MGLPIPMSSLSRRVEALSIMLFLIGLSLRLACEFDEARKSHP